MDKVVVCYHKVTDSMDIWFGDPDNEYICEGAGEGFILKKDREGEVIGIEKLYVAKTLGIRQPLPVEVGVA